MLSKIKYLLILILFFTFLKNSGAQNYSVKIEIGPDEVVFQEGNLIMKVIILNSDQYNITEFPDFRGFKKGSSIVKHNIVLINKKRVNQHIISQNYIPEFSGKIVIPDFDLEVNEKLISVLGKTINVKKNIENDLISNKDVEELDLILKTSKTNIFEGEGVKVNLGFYLSSKTTSSIQFSENISKQIEDIARKLKPKDCLESRRIISNIIGEEEEINGQTYTYYNLFEAIYYPLNVKNINFPAISLVMKKQKSNDFIDFVLYSKPKSVIVNKLPDHPLKEKIGVGVFNLSEKLKNTIQYSGSSFDYTFKVSGTSNFDKVKIGKIENNSQFDFFESNSKIQQDNGEEFGSKEFLFKIVPKEAGEFSFNNLFYLIYFNTLEKKYDTLRSEKKIKVLGENLLLNKSSNVDIYFGIEDLKTDQKKMSIKKLAVFFANFLVVLMIFCFLFLFKKLK